MASPRPFPPKEDDGLQPLREPKGDNAEPTISSLKQILATITQIRLAPRDPCPICLQPSFPGTRITLSCQHAFCAHCLSLWLSSTSAPACPLCRRAYPYNLYPLLLPGFTIALPAGLPVRTAIEITALTTLPPWLLFFLPATAFMYGMDFINEGTNRLWTSAFHLIAPFLTA